jgi:hypothetical protein
VKLSFPIVVVFVSGMIIIAERFLAVPAIGQWAGSLLRWAIIITAFAMGLGAINLLRIQAQYIAKRKEGWINSVILIGAMVFMATLGIVEGTGARIYRFFFDNLVGSMGLTMFAIVAFYIVSGSFKAFVARRVEAAVLLISAVIVMLAAIPLTAVYFPAGSRAAQWIIDVPNMAGQRGIIIGAAIGAVATSFRVLLGLERNHFGSS